MKINKTYRSLLDKSISSMLSAIEIYNKPNFKYREESFAILAVNAWELLFKACILRDNKYKLNSIYELAPANRKDGTKSTSRKKIVENRCGNPKSISIFNAIEKLDKGGKLPKNLKDSIDALIELRDNSIHFFNTDPITKQVQELGFACIKNYIAVIKKWDIDIDLSDYNFYLMPLAYIDEKKIVDATLTSETENYINLVKSKLAQIDTSDRDFDIAISIDIDFKKGNSFESIGVKYDPNGIPVTLSEENIKMKYPWTHAELVSQCRKRYCNFKQNNNFNNILRLLKSNDKFCHLRKLDIDNPKSPKKTYYNANILKELDNHYTK